MRRGLFGQILSGEKGREGKKGSAKIKNISANRVSQNRRKGLKPMHRIKKPREKKGDSQCFEKTRGVKNAMGV